MWKRNKPKPLSEDEIRRRLRTRETIPHGTRLPDDWQADWDAADDALIAAGMARRVELPDMTWGDGNSMTGCVMVYPLRPGEE